MLLEACLFALLKHISALHPLKVGEFFVPLLYFPPSFVLLHFLLRIGNKRDIIRDLKGQGQGTWNREQRASKK